MVRGMEGHQRTVTLDLCMAQTSHPVLEAENETGGVVVRKEIPVPRVTTYWKALIVPKRKRKSCFPAGAAQGRVCAQGSPPRVPTGPPAQLPQPCASFHAESRQNC